MRIFLLRLSAMARQPARYGLSRALAAAWFVLVAAGLQAQTIFVDVNTGDDARTGLGDWTNAVQTISNGVSKAETGWTVLVATGTYQVATNIFINSAITVRSWNAGALDPSNTVIDGQSATRCMYLNHSGNFVAGFTLRNGHSGEEYGGGIYLARGVLSNCYVHHNTSNRRGGGIYIGVAGALAVDCVVYSNTVSPTGDRGGGGVLVNAGELRNSRVFNNGCVTRGGGIFVTANGIVRDCLIHDNNANDGGGICGGWYGAATVVSNRIYDNVATNYGGGILFYMIRKGTMLAHNMVSNNISMGASVGGGGIAVVPDYQLNAGGVVISNCWIVDNIASNFGGGLYGYIPSQHYTNTSMLITHCEISGNQVKTVNASPGVRGGGGIYWEAPGSFENCVIAGNRAPDCTAGGVLLRRKYAPYSDGGYDELLVRNCLVAGNSALIGGGVFLYEANTDKAVRLENCTVAGNAATNYAGGVWFYESTNATLTNVIAYHNSAPADENIRTNNAAYALGYCCVIPTNHLSEPGALANVTTNAPGFMAWESGNYRLDSGSPCLNAGLIQDWAMLPGATDLDGRPRLDRVTRRIDMGCYEGLPHCTIIMLR